MKAFPVIQTARLSLRELAAQDSDELFALYSDPEITLYCDIMTLECREQAEQLAAFFQGQFERGAGIRWAIALKETAQLIGTCGVSWYPHNCSALLSYDIRRNRRGQGFATEAAHAVVDHVFERGVNRITATTVLENPASVRVLQKTGFCEEGILRNWALWKGEFKDLRCFSLLRADRSMECPVQLSEEAVAFRGGQFAASPESGRARI